MVARVAHNHQVLGSNPSLATRPEVNTTGGELRGWSESPALNTLTAATCKGGELPAPLKKPTTSTMDKTPKPSNAMYCTNGVLAIARERVEQLEKHGYDFAHDDQYTAGELEDAAKALLNEDYEQWPKGWPTHEFLRMSEKGTRERLAVIGAFLAAEIDRIDRQLAAEQGSEKLAQA